MYIACKSAQGKKRFLLRKSYPSGPWWTYQDIADLGPALEPYIVYDGRHALYVHEDLDEKIRTLGLLLAPGELEDLFYPHLHPKMQANAACPNRHRNTTQWTENSSELVQPPFIHDFDKRRLLYLKTGQLDLAQVGHLPFKYFRRLAHKSRDELEQIFLSQERDLGEDELKKYVFSAFDLQRFFPRSQLFGGVHALNPDDLEHAFLKVFCELSIDRRFFMTPEAEKELLIYINRYLFFFFDNEFLGAKPRFHGHARPAQQSAQVSEEQLVALFGMGKKEIVGLSRKSLIRIYRQRALLLHPDKGGDHELFIRLTTLYRILLKGGSI